MLWRTLALHWPTHICPQSLCHWLVGQTQSTALMFCLLFSLYLHVFIEGSIHCPLVHRADRKSSQTRQRKSKLIMWTHVLERVEHIGRPWAHITSKTTSWEMHEITNCLYLNLDFSEETLNVGTEPSYFAWLCVHTSMCVLVHVCGCVWMCVCR